MHRSSGRNQIGRIEEAWVKAVEEVRSWKHRFPFSFFLSLTAVSTVTGLVGGVAVFHGFSWFLVAVSVVGLTAAVSISSTLFLCAFVLREQKQDGQWMPEEQTEELEFERAELIEF